MAAPVALRPDFDAAVLRTLAKQSCDPDQTRRLLALATIYDGQPRSEAARIGCVTLQSVRDWVVRFNAQGPAGLINLNTATLAELDTLPGVGPVLAQRIIDHRNRTGGFKSVEELRKVEGVGDARFEQLKDLVTV